MKSMNFIKAFIPPLIVFILHIVVYIYGVYTIYPQIDIPMHFLGGMAISLTCFQLIRIAQEERLILQMHKLICFVFVFSFVALIAVFWEIAEYLIDLYLELGFQEGLTDTMMDLSFGLLGGIIGYFFSINLYQSDVVYSQPK